MGTLENSKLKIVWAREKLEYLEFARERVRQDAAQFVSDNLDANPREIYFHFRDYLGDETLRCVSEFVHHARSALDYIIFALARRDAPKKFRPDNDRTQFPIDKPGQNFERHRTGPLKHLTDEHFTMVKNFQPERGYQSLLLLNRLSNIDKHREFVLITFPGVITDVPIPVAEAQGPTILDTQQMKVERRVIFQILLDDGSDIREALPKVLAQVNQIVDYFDRILG